MYWYSYGIKQCALAGLLFSGIVFMPSCRPDIKAAKGSLTYFDVKGFFEADVARLDHKHTPVTKTVVYNDSTQTKKVYITNWAHELELFINSDINKPAWNQSYTIQTGNGMLIYKAKLPDLKTKSIVIKLTGGKVMWIMIKNYTKNMLYENAEKLTYFPDSAYLIQKQQQVRFLGKNKYVIKGVFFNRD